jgi:hypothetical protein
MAPAVGTEHAWQVFTLQYNISGPLGIVLEPAKEQYLQMFTLLWQFKRAEHALANAFQLLKCSIARSLSKVREGAAGTGALHHALVLKLKANAGHHVVSIV